MFSNTRTTRIEWSDCDPAGIVFYPRYFEMFDISTTVLIERALGMNKIDYLKAYRFAGHPLVETRAKFRIPTRFGDTVEIATAITACLANGGALDQAQEMAGSESPRTTKLYDRRRNASHKTR